MQNLKKKGTWRQLSDWRQWVKMEGVVLDNLLDFYLHICVYVKEVKRQKIHHCNPVTTNLNSSVGNSLEIVM